MSSSTYSRRAGARDVRREYQELVTRKVNQAPFVQDAIIRVVIFCEYISGRYKAFDFVFPDYLNIFINWRDLLEDSVFGDTHEPNTHRLNGQSFRQLYHPNHGSGEEPYTTRYPTSIMVSLNGNIDWKRIRMEAANMQGLSNTDWRMARAWGPNVVCGNQLVKIDDLSRFAILELDEHNTFKICVTARQDGALNRFNGPQLAQTLTNNIICQNVVYFNTEADVIDFAHSEHIAYIDQAAEIASAAKAKISGNNDA